jgi:uncharacterized protein (DUF2267 family)
MARETFEHSGDVLGAPREAAAEEMFHEIVESGDLPLGIDAREAASAVLCTLLGRLELGQARRVLDALGPEVEQAIGRCPIHGGEPGESFQADDLVRRVSEHFQLAPDAVEPMTASVLHAVRRQLPPQVAALVENQLPRAMRNLWRNGGLH